MVKGVLTSLYTRGIAHRSRVSAPPRFRGSEVCREERMERLYLGVITVASTYTLVSTALLILVFMR